MQSLLQQRYLSVSSRSAHLIYMHITTKIRLQVVSDIWQFELHEKWIIGFSLHGNFTKVNIQGQRSGVALVLINFGCEKDIGN